MSRFKTNYSNSKFIFFYFIHFVICFLLIFGWIFRNKLWLEFLIMASMYIQTMYGCFDGCICTRLERMYSKWRKDNKSSIVDPFIYLFTLTKNRNNVDFVTGLFVNSGLICAILMRYIYLS